MTVPRDAAAAPSGTVPRDAAAAAPSGTVPAGVPAAQPEASPAFRFTRAVEVRFRDLDAMGHAHHTLPLVYLEEARAAYWREVAGRASVEEIDYVMGEIQVRFHARILWPATLTVALATVALGRSSFRMAFEIRDQAGTLLASGNTSHVMFDYDSQRSIRISRELRRRLAEFEGLSGGDTS